MSWTVSSCVPNQEVRPDDDESVSTGMAGGPDVRHPKRIPRIQAGQGLHERRAGAVQKGFASRCRVKQSEDDDIQVGVLHGVHDDEGTAGHAGEDVGHPLWSAQADVVKGDGCYLARLDRAGALLGDELTQVRGGVSERGIAANSVSPTGTSLAPTRAQCTLPAVNLPASKYAGTISTPS